MNPIELSTKPKLFESENSSLLQILEHSPNEAYVFDIETFHFIHVNESARHNLGYSREEFDVMTPLDIMPQFTEESFKGIIDSLVTGDSSKIIFEANQQRKDKTSYAVEIHLQMHIIAGQPVLFSSIVGVSNALPALTIKIGETDERLSTAFMQASLGMLLISLDGHILKINPAVVKILGYAEQSLLTMPLHDFIHKSQHQIYDEYFFQLLSGAIHTYQKQFDFIHHSQKTIHIQLIVSLVRNDNNEPLYFFSQIQDISDQKRVKESLLESEKRYRLLVENAPVCIHEIDLNGHLQSMNKAGLDMMGTDNEHSVCGMNFLHVVADEDVNRISTMLAEAYKGVPSFFDYKVKTQSGVRSFDSCFIPILDKSGGVQKIMGVTQDKTEQKRSEAERLDLERQMQFAQKLESLGVLSGGIAHDFNNLLTSILGYADLARTELDDDLTAVQHITEVIKGARQAASLTQQLLAYSGRGKFLISPINLSNLIDEMKNLLQISISKKCQLNITAQHNPPAIEADTNQIQQIIMNLVINGSDAIGKQQGTICVSTGVKNCDTSFLSKTILGENLESGDYVFLEVSDDGCGMEENVQARIFEPFFSTKYSGYGLGLAAIFGIVRGHKGAITLKSKPGDGSTFTLYFPVTDKPIGVEKLNENKPSENWQASGTVLIVDDEKAILTLAERMFIKMGFSVLLASDGREGIDILSKESENIDLVLLDLSMPHLNGEETLEAMQVLRADVKAILSSGYDKCSTTNRFAGKGLAGFIQKPYTFKDLQEVVFKVMND